MPVAAAIDVGQSLAPLADSRVLLTVSMPLVVGAAGTGV
jgi:hypothetical protein